ncbi:MAG: YtpR family tRNA-binding protein, partial [Cyanobacteria bacterium J06648_11]
MKISLNWLRELVDFDLEPEALGEALTLAGFEVEDIEDRRTWADGVVVGHILEADRHPNADRLQVCQVDIGQAEPATIVCGAANARQGLYVAVAVPGTYLPAIDLTLKRTKLRGVKSEGMICSLSELNLAKTSEGIHEFAGEPEVGSDVRPLLGLDDVVLDLTSTANRADALSMVGIAREVAALTRNAVDLPIAEPPVPDRAAEVTLRVADENACPAYSGSLIRGVTMGPSPEWVQRRVEAAGMRPINVVVDVTNFVLLEWGQ